MFEVRSHIRIINQVFIAVNGQFASNLGTLLKINALKKTISEILNVNLVWRSVQKTSSHKYKTPKLRTRIRV